MRIIHPDLITAQHSGASGSDPFFSLIINSTNYASRLISLEHVEEQYRERAVIVLANSDRHFDGNDLTGKSFNIGYGYATASGNRFTGDGNGSEAMPTLWVKSQSIISIEGELVCVLLCEGGWKKLNEFGFITVDVDAPYFSGKITAANNVFEMIEKALEEAGFTLNPLGTQDDGIINTFNPIFTVNPLDFDSPAFIIYRLLLMTKTFLRQVEGGAFEIVYPRITDSINEFYLKGAIAPFFKDYVEKKNLLIPNHIVVFANRDPDTGEWATPESPLITGHARDPDQFTGDTYTGSYTEVIEYHTAPYIGEQADADNRAEAILSKYKIETLAGRIVLPFHDCRVELYDRILVVDTRGS